MKNFTKNKKIFLKLILAIFLLLVFLINFKIVQSLFQPTALIKDLSFVIGEIEMAPLPTPEPVSTPTPSSVPSYSPTPTPSSENLTDETPPSLKVYSAGFLIREAIDQTWQIGGEVAIGDELIKIGNALSNNLWNQNYITEEIDNVPQLKNIGFEYKLESLEDLAGFDQLAFGVSVNDQLVFYAAAEDRGDFKQVILDLSRFKSQILQIKFMAGNSGDSLNSSWVELKNISTNWLVTNSVDKIVFKAVDNSDLPVVITEEEIDGKKIVSAQDWAGNVNRQTFNYLLDTQVPGVITDFSFAAEPNSEATLEFQAPSENTTLTNYYFYDLNDNLLVEKPTGFFNLNLPPNNFEKLETKVLQNIGTEMTRLKIISEDTALNKSEIVFDFF